METKGLNELSDGDDLRVYVDCVEATRWLVDDMNAASAPIWVVVDLDARGENE
jgi:hypothetical protein